MLGAVGVALYIIIERFSTLGAIAVTCILLCVPPRSSLLSADIIERFGAFGVVSCRYYLAFWYLWLLFLHVLFVCRHACFPSDVGK